MCACVFFFGAGEWRSEQHIKRLECANTNLISAMLLVISVHWSHYMLNDRFENHLSKSRLKVLSIHNHIYYAHKSQLLTQHLMWYGLSRLPFGSEPQFGKMNRVMSVHRKHLSAHCHPVGIAMFFLFGCMIKWSISVKTSIKFPSFFSNTYKFVLGIYQVTWIRIS